jgi:hypothetical protein
MKTFSFKGIEAIERLKSDSLLLDASLLALKIFVQEFVVTCDLIIKPRPDAEFSEIFLRIEGIKRFDFYYDESKDFYLIDRFKIFSTNDNNVYLSLDPYDEADVETEKDCGVIVGKGVTFRVSY